MQIYQSLAKQVADICLFISNRIVFVRPSLPVPFPDGVRSQTIRAAALRDPPFGVKLPTLQLVLDLLKSASYR